MQPAPTVDPLRAPRPRWMRRLDGVLVLLFGAVVLGAGSEGRWATAAVFAVMGLIGGIRLQSDRRRA